MKTLRVNFTIPEDIDAMLRTHVGARQRSAFVAEALRGKLHQLEQERLEQILAEGYLARSQEDLEINKEWEKVTLEGWK